MDRYAPETNTYVNIVLEIIYRLGGNRSITFSSFSPEVCILLSLKQQDYPVLFLSKAGSVPVGDVRCSGLQQSIHFAKRWNLAGMFVYCVLQLANFKSLLLLFDFSGSIGGPPRYQLVSRGFLPCDAIIVWTRLAKVHCHPRTMLCPAPNLALRCIHSLEIPKPTKS